MTATKKKNRPRVTVASNVFHPRPNILRPLEAKTQSIVSYEGVSEEGGGSPEKTIRKLLALNILFDT